MPVEKVKLICKNCNSEFYRYPCQIKKRENINSGIFCSLKCRDSGHRNGILRTCSMCGIEFYRKASEERKKKSKTVFCSLECCHNYRELNAKKTTYLKDNAVHRHIVIAEKALQRALNPGEVVHHIDENKHNNHIENLAVLPSQSIHAKVHFSKYNFDKYRLVNMIKNV